ncbi:MAG: hypothetical protein FJX80_08175 [Bacteroidetes bacterium]|nr:hypothetical protein [Bacteroidota bacterium]
MIRLFLMNRVWVLLLLPLVIAIFQYLHWISGNISSEIADFGLWGEWQLTQNISYVFSGIFLVANAVTLNYSYNSYEFLDRNSYLTSLLYVIAMSFYKAFYEFNYVICVHFLFILMLLQFYEMKQHLDARKYVFNAFIIIGLATTFQPLLLFFFPIFATSVLIFRPFIIREFILSILGFLVPFIYCFTYLWYSNSSPIFEFEWSIFTTQNTELLGILATYFALITIAYFSIRSRLQKSSVRLKKQILLLWLFVIIGLITGILVQLGKNELNDFSISILFLTSLLTYSFLHKTYGLIASVVLYVCMIYSMLKFFV